MDPLIVGAVISVASGIAQAYNSEQQRGADKKKLAEMRRLFESIVPPEYDIKPNDPPEYITKALQEAKFDFSKFTPEQFKLIGKYAPEAAQYVQEQAPTLIKGTAAQKEGRGAQIEALRQMQAEAKGESPEFAIKIQQARDAAQAQAQSRQQSILEAAQRRGMGGGGLALAAQLQGAGDSMASGANLSQQAAIAAYQNKLANIQSAGQMGRQLSADELSQEQTNANIVNDFNQRTSRQYQDYLMQRAAMQNDAQLRNLQAQQDIANANVSAGNEAQRYNLESQNRLAQQVYQNQVGERNYQNTLAAQRAQWAASEKDRQNELKRQAYQDQLSRASGMSGQYQAEMNSGRQATQDRNAMIGAIAGAGAGYFGGQAQANAQAEAQRREDERLEKMLKLRYPQYGNISDVGNYGGSPTRPTYA